jgi:peptidoglycan/xylan/chitin deacetylase (PgdA/CDA1 family)
VREALPALRESGIPATFFLSGRALHGLGPYWFQCLEQLLIANGKARTAELLGVAHVSFASFLLRCEQSSEIQQRIEVLTRQSRQATPPDVLQPDGIRALGAAGMAIGFHTIDHRIVRDLNDRALDDAVSRGRDELAAASGVPVKYFAYPHGKADLRSAAAVRQAGFDAAFTGVPRPVRHTDDPYRLGRWEPGPLTVDDLVVKLAVRFHRAASQGGRIWW